MTDTGTQEWMQAGERAVRAAVAGLDDADLAGPAALPDWTRGHVLTHLARNADALRNLLDWGRTGVEHPMYPSRAHRNADIAAGAGRPATEQRADLDRTATELAADLAGYPVDRWDVVVKGGATGRLLPVSEVPWLRTREVWLHLVDLDVGVGLDGLPAGVTERLCRENLATYAAREDSPAAQVWLEPDPDEIELGTGGGPQIVGTPADLVGWLTGRGPAPAGAPVLPAWL